MPYRDAGPLASRFNHNNVTFRVGRQMEKHNTKPTFYRLLSLHHREIDTLTQRHESMTCGDMRVDLELQFT